MNITLTGNLGSGKTSVCNELKKMGYNIISAGSIFRSIADEKNMSVIELNTLAEVDKSIDNLIDSRSAKLGQELDNTVFDSRLAWYFIPNSFKVFLSIDTNEAAKRVFNGKNRNAETYRTMEDAVNGLTNRALLEQQRFKEMYNIDYYNMSNYDLIINATYMSPQDVANKIIDEFNKQKEVLLCI